MRKIRLRTFETNSSMAHALQVMSREDYEKWRKGKLYVKESDTYKNPIDVKEKRFYTEEELETLFRESLKDENILDEDDLDLMVDYYHDWKMDEGYQTYEDWTEDDWLEYFGSSTIKTQSGDEVVIMIKAGRDG